MTNRDPNVPDFQRKVNEYIDCLANYWQISSPEKLKSDLNRQDVDLVCKYELEELKKHLRQTHANYLDFVKPVPAVERQIQEKLDRGYQIIKQKI